MKECLTLIGIVVFCFVLGTLTGSRESKYQKTVDKALAECEASLVSTNAPRNIKCTVEIRAISKAG